MSKEVVNPITPLDIALPIAFAVFGAAFLLLAYTYAKNKKASKIEITCDPSKADKTTTQREMAMVASDEVDLSTERDEGNRIAEHEDNVLSPQ